MTYCCWVHSGRKGGSAFGWSRQCYIFPLHNLTHASLTLKAEATLQEENNSRQPRQDHDWKLVRGLTGGRSLLALKMYSQRGGALSSLLLSREKGGMRTSKWEPSVLSIRNVPLNRNNRMSTITSKDRWIMSRWDSLKSDTSSKSKKGKRVTYVRCTK